MFTSTGGYWTMGVDAVRPSTRSMLAPEGGERSTKLPPASVSVNAEPSVTVTFGIGWGTASAVSTRPVMAGVSGARTLSVNAAVRVRVRPSTWASPVTVRVKLPRATVLLTARVTKALEPGATRFDGEKPAVIPAGSVETDRLTRLVKLPLPSVTRLTEV